MSGVFSDLEIVKAIETGQIYMDPLDERFIQGSSVDLRLGGNFFHCKSSTTGKNFLNPYDEASIRDYFEGPHQAMRHDTWCDLHGYLPFNNFKPEHQIIVLRPQERLLAHTVEYIGVKFRGTTKMQARSTLGRLGIEVCKDAGWGDPGYFNRWTMEIKNNNDVMVPLIVGTPVAQLAFFHMSDSSKDYGTKGSYQRAGELDDIKESWSPYQMLPNRLRVPEPLEPIAA